jgi:hypothetical protein
VLRCGQNVGHFGHFLAFARENIGPSGYLSMNMAAWQLLESGGQGVLHLRKASRLSKRLIVFAIAVLLGRRDIAVFDVIVLLGRRLWLAWFAARFARRLLLLAGSAHVVLVGWFVSSDQNVTPAFSVKVRPGSG